MFSIKHSTVLPLSIACASLVILAACGGGSSDSSTPVTSSPETPTTPTTPTTTPTTPTTEPTTPTTPTTPAEPEITLETGYTEIAASLNFSQSYWPAWSYTGSATLDGVGCARNENYHIHALLSIYRDGQRLRIPDSIGRGGGCTYEMHTHEGSGVLHIETDVPKTFTLGQWFSLWGQTLGTDSVAGLTGPVRYYVIENETITRVTGSPADIALAAHKEILIVTGTPPTTVPRYNWASTGL
jgi:hypothetical protein